MNRQRRMRCAGTASVEIVVMLPVFVLLFVGAYHLHRLAQGELQTRQDARACAWEYAMSGCQLAQGEGLCARARPETRPKLGDDEYEPAVDGRVAESESKRAGAFALLEGIPVVGAITAFFFGEPAAAHARLQVPAFLQSGHRQISASTHLVCNTFVESWEDKIKSSLCGVAQVFGIGDVSVGDMEIFGCAP